MSSFGYSGTIVHALIDHNRDLFHVLSATTRIAYRRRIFQWRDCNWRSLERSCEEHEPPIVGVHQLPPTVETALLASGTMDFRACDRRTDTGTLVHLSLNSESGLAILELHDPLRFNTISWALGDDIRRSVKHLQGRRDELRGLVLQGAGSVFCAGGNPYGLIGSASLSDSARSLLDSVEGVVCMRNLRVPISCAVHGDVIGGAAAIFLQADLRVAESEATFQHGNLSRGVCVLRLPA